jgi:hypothetical protein
VRVVVATGRGQGGRDNDFNFCVEGELVLLGVICARDEADPDGGCGCGRSFSGLSSHRATTTAEVRDIDLTRADLLLAVQSYLEASGWAALALGDDPARALVDELIELGETFDVGTVLERRIDDVRPRV